VHRRSSGPLQTAKFAALPVCSTGITGKSSGRGVAMHVEGDSLLIGRHVHHSAFSLPDIYFSQSDEEEVGQ
jgi:hypothetical protein